MKYQKGEIVAAIVTGITDYGIFVQLNEDASGLIHISEISSRYVNSIEKYVSLGEVIRVQILDSTEDGKYCLSIKNIDYRISHQKSKIKETRTGFSTLALDLDKWIEESLLLEK